jgi:aryl-alcohol dehydrogenase-like predicted oxidoreductase
VRGIVGRATLEGTRRFAKRSDAAEGHFREAMGLVLSSIGLGTYLGDESARTDSGYEGAVAAALASGINVFDTAINYRGQKSERAIGRALARAFESGAAARDEVFVSTKGGYLPHDADDPRPGRRYVTETFLDTGIAPKAEVAQGCHCMSPGYLEDQIERSRTNLGLETIDLYYLHNVETQLEEAGSETFRSRLSRAVETLEAAAGSGKIGAWGLATWNGLRVPPEHPEHISLASIEQLAREIAGDGHHFRGVQLPVNLAMAHAVAFRSQQLASAGKVRVPPLEATQTLGLAAFGSASLLQGRLAVELPDLVVEAFPEADTPARRALQFARSAPGLTAALVGVSSPEHASENFGLAAVSPSEPDRILGLFGGGGN